MLARFPGLKFLQGKNGDVPVSSLEGKYVLVYFSAHWCPPCRAFTPQLAAFYKRHSKDKNLEIIFASWDQNKAEFEEYFKEHPWLAFPFETSESIIKTLGSNFSVQSIPTLLVFGPDGKLITREGRMSVVRDPSAENFPWVGADAAAKKQGLSLQLVVGVVVALYIIYSYFLK